VIDTQVKASAPSRSIWQSGLAILFVGTFLVVVARQSWLVGTKLRDDIWIANRGNHFIGDIDNAFAQGRHVLDLAHGLDAGRHRDNAGPLVAPDKFTLGEILEAMHLDYMNPPGDMGGGGSNRLDYPPGRLLVATLWTRWAAAPEHFPTLGGWNDGPTLFVSEPMLRLNTWAAAESAVAMFFLVLVWVLRGGRGDPSSPAAPVIEKWWP
jgi:hypothetical protein